MKPLFFSCLGLCLASLVSARDQTLDLYWSDSEDSCSTLVVKPEGDSV